MMKSRNSWLWRTIVLLSLLSGVWISVLPAVAWAEAFLPTPYIYKDRGLGAGNPKFTLNESGVLPDWLSLSVQHRTRYETLKNPFRRGATGSDQVLSLRTLAQATLHLPDNFKVQLELQDSRAEYADAGTPLNTSIVNTLELLEANVQWHAQGLIEEGSQILFRGGRITIDIGTRRLVARNRFRNTKNGFTGIDGIWKSKTGTTVRSFLTLPVSRQPTARNRLLQNEAEFDEETANQVFWGLYFSSPQFVTQHQVEIYVFGLQEQDGPNFNTRNRKLYTPGFRGYRSPKTGQLDYEWESVFQFGTSRATTAVSDTRDLDHFAHFHHAEMGYTFNLCWTPRLILAYDYASGDGNPGDGKNGRFDPLFGATVFDFGPTSIHRPFIRSNVHGPGVKFILQPHPTLKTSIHYRALWLASDTDVWGGNSGLRDTTGQSGSFLGQQWFLRGKWQAFPNIALESGVVARIDGDFQETVPNGSRQGDSLYTYLSATLSF